MPEFEVFITNRDLTVNRRMYQYTGLSVEHPLNDSRTCKFTCPIYDINAVGQSNIQHFLPLRRYVKVFYRGRLVFNGPIIKPIFNLAENRVEVNAHDPTFWWKYHHFSEEDVALHDGVKVNGDGLWDMADAANLNSQEAAAGFLSPGIVEGPTENYLLPGEEERRRYRVERGAGVFDQVAEMASFVDGPDWEVVPIDLNHDPDGVYEAGALGMFRAYEELSRDREDTVVFHYGWGRMNLSNFIYEPDANTVRNRMVIESQRGALRVAKYVDGMEEVGIMEGWESALGRHPTAESMTFQAHETVEAYGEPLSTFTIEPTWDQGLMGSAIATPWRYPNGYRPGDRIRAVAKLGRFAQDLTGRVTKVTLNQLDQAENAQSQIEVIPEQVATFEIDEHDYISDAT